MGAYATKFGKQDFEEAEKDPETIEEELEALEKEVENIIKETHQIGELSSASKNLALKRLRDSDATDLYKRIEDTIGFLTSETYLDFALKHGKIWMEAKINHPDFAEAKLMYPNLTRALKLVVKLYNNGIINSEISSKKIFSLLESIKLGEYPSIPFPHYNSILDTKLKNGKLKETSRNYTFIYNRDNSIFQTTKNMTKEDLVTHKEYIDENGKRFVKLESFKTSAWLEVKPIEWRSSEGLSKDGSGSLISFSLFLARHSSDSYKAYKIKIDDYFYTWSNALSVEIGKDASDEDRKKAQEFLSKFVLREMLQPKELTKEKQEERNEEVERSIANIENQKKEEKEKERIEQEKKRQEEIQARKARKIVESRKKIYEALEVLKEEEVSIEEISRFPLKEEIFIHQVGDHKEIVKEYIPLLKYIDLSFVTFEDVDIHGIDFTDCNTIMIDPQKVYDKDLSECKFEHTDAKGHLPFSISTSFDGVKLNGTRIIDNDMAMTSENFKGAITDDKTHIELDGNKLPSGPAKGNSKIK